MLLDLADFADRQIAEHERAVAGADQARDLEAEIFEHAADFAILALGQDHFDPHVCAGAAFEIGVDRAVAHAFDLDAVDQLLKLLLRDRPVGAGAVGALDAGGGQFELALQLAIGGEQQQPLGIEIESPDRHEAREVLRQPVIDRRATGRITLGDEQAGGLMIEEQPRRLGCGDGHAIDGDAVQRLQDRRGRIEHDAVECDPPFSDHPLDLAAGGNSGAGEQFGDALLILGADGRLWSCIRCGFGGKSF